METTKEPKTRAYRCKNDNCKVYKSRMKMKNPNPKTARHVIFYGYIGPDSWISGYECQCCGARFKMNIEEEKVDTVELPKLQLPLKKSDK